MKHWDVVIMPDGSIQSLYTDKIPWTQLGEIEVERVSDVPFDTEQQNFQVVDLDGNPLLESDERFAKRGDAIEAEIQHFFSRMEKGDNLWISRSKTRPDSLPLSVTIQSINVASTPENRTSIIQRLWQTLCGLFLTRRK